MGRESIKKNNKNAKVAAWLSKTSPIFSLWLWLIKIMPWFQLLEPGTTNETPSRPSPVLPLPLQPLFGKFLAEKEKTNSLRNPLAGPFAGPPPPSPTTEHNQGYFFWFRLFLYFMDFTPAFSTHTPSPQTQHASHQWGASRNKHFISFAPRPPTRAARRVHPKPKSLPSRSCV